MTEKQLLAGETSTVSKEKDGILQSVESQKKMNHVNRLMHSSYIHTHGAIY